MPDAGHDPSPATALADPAGLGRLDPTALAAALRPLWEDAGPLVDALAGRSFASWEAVIDAAEEAIAGMDERERASLLAAHPRIGAPPEALASRSRLSWLEQGGDTVTAPEVHARLEELNDRYEARFGFACVEWVRGRPRADLVAVIEARLARDRATELDAGSAALVAIARDRLRSEAR